MARAKILFDKQNLQKILSPLNIYEKGVFLTLCDHLFHEGHYAYLYDSIRQVRFTRTMVIQMMADMNISYESAEIIITRLFDHGVLAMEGIHIICPEISRQEKVSHARKRNTGFSKKAPAPAPAITEQGLADLKANQDDIKAQMAIESMDKKELSDKEKKYAQHAWEVLEYLNTRARRPAGFQNIPSNTKFIIARLKEGHTIEQLKMVVDYKTEEWIDTSFDYCLRPGTLFIPKNFTGYLNTAMKRYEAKQNDKPHPLKDYISKYYKNVSAMRVQMTHEDCEKIKALAGNSDAGNKLIRDKLTYMENSSNLGKYSGVYLRLRELIENDKKQTGTITSRAK